jgi:RNA polymerase sigma-70 factor (ECF subfamily)
LLEAVRDPGNDAAWRRFHDTYARLVYGVARSQGLSETEAQEVVQDTMLSVARTMPDFQYDPARCSFKTWLLHLTRKRIVDHLRRRP